MRFPNKITSYKESSFPKMVLILEELENGDLSPEFLYERLNKKIKSLNEYIELLTCLYALNKVVLTDLGELHYVSCNTK